MPTVFVTGGSGFVGKLLIKDLRNKGSTVRALARSQQSSKIVVTAGAEPILGDLHDHAALERGMQGCDAVYHCASTLGVNTDDREILHRDNIIGTINVVQAAVNAGVRRIVYISSIVAVFTGEPLVNYEENLPIPPNLCCYYAVTKAEGEKIVLEMPGIEAVVIRLPVVWGAGDSILPGLVRMAKRGLWVWPGGARYKVSPLHVINASHGIVLIGEKGRPGQIYNLCDDVTPTFKQLFGDRLRNAGCAPWQLGEAIFSRDFPLWIFWGLVFWLEYFWHIFHLSGAPPIPREGIAIVGTEMTASDKKARNLGYKPIISYEAGLANEGAWIREQFKKR